MHVVILSPQRCTVSASDRSVTVNRSFDRTALMPGLSRKLFTSPYVLKQKQHSIRLRAAEANARYQDGTRLSLPSSLFYQYQMFCITEEKNGFRSQLYGKKKTVPSKTLKTQKSTVVLSLSLNFTGTDSLHLLFVDNRSGAVKREQP